MLTAVSLLCWLFRMKSKLCSIRHKFLLSLEMDIPCKRDIESFPNLMLCFVKLDSGYSLDRLWVHWKSKLLEQIKLHP